MKDGARAARYSDLFGADPEFQQDGAEAPVKDPIPFPGAWQGHEHERPADCAYCPICATISVVRNTRPEVMGHLAAAARELLAAASILVEEAGKVVAPETTEESPPG